jgi:hypothetical protein
MIYRLTKDDIISFGSEVKSVFTFFISVALEQDFLKLNHEFNIRLNKDYLSYFVIDASPSQDVNDTLKELGIASSPSLLLKIRSNEGIEKTSSVPSDELTISEKTFAIKFSNIEDYLRYIDAILSKNNEIIKEFDPELEGSSELISYLSDTLRLI